MKLNDDADDEDDDDDYDDEADKIPRHHLGFCPLGFILHTMMRMRMMMKRRMMRMIVMVIMMIVHGGFKKVHRRKFTSSQLLRNFANLQVFNFVKLYVMN